MADEGKVADVRDLALPAVIAIAVPGAAFALMGVMPLMAGDVPVDVEKLR